MDVRGWLARDLLVAGPVHVRGADAVAAVSVVGFGLGEVVTGRPPVLGDGGDADLVRLPAGRVPGVRPGARRPRPDPPRRARHGRDRRRLVLSRRAEDRDRARAALEQAEAERDLRVRAAVGAERLLMARDLHDAVAHLVTVMVMTAGAVRRLLAPGQEHQRAALSDVEAVGREAVGEMHRIVNALRDGEEPAPQADLSRLGELVGQARRTGAEISLDAGELDVIDVPFAVSSAAYRIVQESLTNALRHAPGAPAAVRVRREAGGLRVDVADGGDAAPREAPGTGGFGIQGMRERAALLGGALDAGPRGDAAGWRVSAWLPAVAPSEAAAP